MRPSYLKEIVGKGRMTCSDCKRGGGEKEGRKTHLGKAFNASARYAFMPFRRFLSLATAGWVDAEGRAGSAL